MGADGFTRSDKGNLTMRPEKDLWITITKDPDGNHSIRLTSSGWFEESFASEVALELADLLALRSIL